MAHRTIDDSQELHGQVDIVSDLKQPKTDNCAALYRSAMQCDSTEEQNYTGAVSRQAVPPIRGQPAAFSASQQTNIMPRFKCRM